MKPQLPLEVELSLVARLQDGDIAARNELVMDSDKIIFAKAWKYHAACKMEPSDLTQAIFLYVLKEAPKYKYEPGKRFRKFVNSVCVSAVGFILRQTYAKKRNAVIYNSLDNPELVSEIQLACLDPNIEDIQVLEYVISRMSKKDQKFLLARIDLDNLHVNTMPEAAEIVGVNLPTYNRVYYMAINKVKINIDTSNIDYPYDLRLKKQFTHESDAKRKRVSHAVTE